MQDILLICGLPVSKPTVRYAAALAGLWNGQLTGLHVCAPMNVQPDPARPAATSMQLQWEQDRLTRARAAADDFERWANTACHGRCSWKTASGALAEVVAAVANWHDLLVLQRGASQPGGWMPGLAQLILTSSVPVLVLPSLLAEAPRPARVAVFWDGTPESTRALHSALACVRTASEVVVFANPAEAGSHDFDPAEYLRAHGVVHTLQSLDANVLTASQLLMAMAGFQADLLVFAARGNSRFGEWRLDAFSCLLIEAAQVPILTVR